MRKGRWKADVTSAASLQFGEIEKLASDLFPKIYGRIEGDIRGQLER